MSGETPSDGQEKSHEASASRIARARRSGDVSQSKEVNAAASYLGLYLSLALVASNGTVILASVLSRFLQDPNSFSSAAFGAGATFIRYLAGATASAAGLFLLLPAAGTFSALLIQRSISFTPSKLKPNLARISIVANAKKKFGPEGIAEFVKSSIKLVLIFTLFAIVFIEQFTQMPGESLHPSIGLPHTLLRQGILFLGLIVLFSVVVAAIDLPWTLQQYQKRLRMTQEEAKRETKENEGDPVFKQNRRSRAQSIATNRMLHDVPEADVVIVNPTHFAVALSWERTKPGAPICVAKGVDSIAGKIREVASLSGVPIQRNPPAARAIHASVEIGEEIKSEHFAAVAAAIHFADAVRAKANCNNEYKQKSN